MIMKKTLILAVSAAVLAMSVTASFATREKVHKWWWGDYEAMNDQPFSADTWAGCLSDENCGDDKDRPLAWVKGEYRGYEYSSDDEGAPWNVADPGDWLEIQTE
jgi:opacity protein-like surface antigen